MFRFHPYRVPHLEEKEGPFCGAFPTFIAVLLSATVVIAIYSRLPASSLLTYPRPIHIVPLHLPTSYPRLFAMVFVSSSQHDTELRYLSSHGSARH